MDENTQNKTEIEIDAATLIKMAEDARMSSYCPYSGYAVGAALLCSDGYVFTGCNIENAAFGPGICAERCAIYKAVSCNHKDFLAIAIAGSPVGDEITQFSFPCGVCRQVMREFTNPNKFIVIVAGPNDTYVEKTLEEFLPNSFGPDNLM